MQIWYGLLSGWVLRIKKKMRRAGWRSCWLDLAVRQARWVSAGLGCSGPGFLYLVHRILALLGGCAALKNAVTYGVSY